MDKAQFSRAFKKSARDYIIKEIKRLTADIEEIYFNKKHFKDVDLDDLEDQLDMRHNQFRTFEKQLFNEVKQEFFEMKKKDLWKIFAKTTHDKDRCYSRKYDFFWEWDVEDRKEFINELYKDIEEFKK